MNFLPWALFSYFFLLKYSQKVYLGTPAFLKTPILQFWLIFGFLRSRNKKTRIFIFWKKSYLLSTPWVNFFPWVLFSYFFILKYSQRVYLGTPAFLKTPILQFWLIFGFLRSRNKKTRIYIFEKILSFKYLEWTSYLGLYFHIFFY